MIGYVKGTVVGLNPNQTFIDINGLGYEVHITLYTYEAIKEKKEVLLYTHLQVREDAWTLYGFATEIEKETFQKLLSVSGVGAATARVMLSSLTATELAKIIAQGDAKALEKVKGIGAKSAQRIILELKGKLNFDVPDLEMAAVSMERSSLQDAVQALIGLGIPKPNAEKAVKVAQESLGAGATVEELIKLGLKNI